MAKKLTTRRQNVDLSFYAALSTLRAEIDTLICDYGEDAFLDMDAGYENISFEVTYQAEETDKEYEARVKYEKKTREQNKKAKAAREKKELVLYEQLRAKYENKK